MKNYATRLKHAMELKGISQSALAREASKISGRKITPQAIQHLCDADKNAEGSVHTPIFALITNVDPVWLAVGKGMARSGDRRRTPRIHETTQDECIGKFNQLPETLKNQIRSIIGTLHTLTQLGFNVDLSPGEAQRTFLNTLDYLKNKKEHHK